MKSSATILKTFIFITVTFGFIKPQALQAQNNCKNSLYEANKLFESGKLNECITTLENCMSSQKGQDEKLESFRLLAQAYQNLNNEAKANFYIRKMLTVKHDYQKFPNIDPINFRRLVNKFKVRPKLFVGLKIGINQSEVDLKRSYSVYSTTQRYKPMTGYQFGIFSEYIIKPSSSLVANVFFQGLGINHIIDSAGGWKQNVTEQQNYAGLLLGYQYTYNIKDKLSLYAGLGLGTQYLYSSNVFIKETNLITDFNQRATQNPIESRNKWQMNAYGALGISVPMSKGILSLEGQYSYFFNNTVNPDKRMDDLNFIFNNHYVNDDISLRLWSVNLSYKHPVIWQISSIK